ncbi:hypothetical protein PENARI_c047G05696 [Penicillium arizonense]|uniref:Uncharacterized protein n=1 Tax=Penicillium arizonense TaxID=1835702 RepID=A0A1F5L2A2_PENAI|nr:hypothetical protein PENARI_c047G05696 [Penicillium arizonense]OGE47368.1 hypothetical protein PENARI_c047G05696 [Penicillium arizonense]
MPHMFSAMPNSASTGAPAQSSNAREQAGRPSDVAPVFDHDQNSHGKTIAILFYVFSCDQFIVISESLSQRDFNITPYPWWEEQQCIPDTGSFISDIEESVKDQLESDGWLLERGEHDSLLDPFSHELDAVIVAQRYIPAVEDWLQREVKDPDYVSPVDGDIDP